MNPLKNEVMRAPSVKTAPKALPKTTSAISDSHTDRVRASLAEEIISGNLRPGQRLDVRTIAERFEISRTPVREALRQLVPSGLVEWRPNRGAVVATITIMKMVEMFEFMAEVEGLCGRLSSRRMNPEEQQNMRTIHCSSEAAARAGDREGYILLNRPFHEAIYAGAHNNHIREHASELYVRLAPYRAYHVKQSGQLLRSYDEHEAIVNAIISGDGDTAYRLLREHVMLDSDLFTDMISSLSNR